MEDRLQKILSAAGVCSRRRAETYIQQGRVTVNGRPGVLGERADPDRDQIALDGVPVGRRGDHQVLMLYKPRGVVTTLSDEKGRPTVAVSYTHLPGDHRGRWRFPCPGGPCGHTDGPDTLCCCLCPQSPRRSRPLPPRGCGGPGETGPMPSGRCPLAPMRPTAFLCSLFG